MSEQTQLTLNFGRGLSADQEGLMTDAVDKGVGKAEKMG